MYDFQVYDVQVNYVDVYDVQVYDVHVYDVQVCDVQVFDVQVCDAESEATTAVDTTDLEDLDSSQQEPTASNTVENQRKAKSKTQDYHKEALEDDEDFYKNTMAKEGIITCTETGCQFQCVEEDEFYARSHRSKHRKQNQKTPLKKKLTEPICNICKSVVSNSKQLEKHYREEHALASYQCIREDCNKTFLQKFRFNEHLKSHDKVSCPKCSKKFGRNADLNRHVRAKHRLSDSVINDKVKCLKETDCCMEEWRIILEKVKCEGCPAKTIKFCEEFLANFPMCEDVWLLLLQTLGTEAAGRHRIISTFKQVNNNDSYMT